MKNYVHRPNYSRISKLAQTIEKVHEIWAIGFFTHDEEKTVINRLWNEIYWEMTGESWNKGGQP